MTSFFVKCCREQLHWLVYCLQFLAKNWKTQDTEVICLLDEDCRPVVETWGRIAHTIYTYCQPWPDPYMHALWCKACADYWTRGDPIILIDADTLLLEEASLGDFMVDDEQGITRILLWYLEWADRGDNGVAKNLWSRIVKESTGMDLDRDYMVTRPWIFARSTYYGARLLVEEHREMPFYAAVYSRAHYDWHNYLNHPFTFCDLENLGFFAAHCSPQTYLLKDFAAQKPKEPFHDMWSHTDWTPELINHLDGLLTAPC